MAVRRFGRVGAVVLPLLLVAVAGVAERAAATALYVDGKVLVSVDDTGVLGNGNSDNGVLSGNGRYLAFVSSATNLVPGDTNQVADVFVKDLQTGTTERVSVSAGGAQGNAAVVGRPAISASGRYVAFTSRATKLVPDDRNNANDVFVRDRSAGTTVRVSVSGTGVEGNRSSGQPAINRTGRVVAFMSEATNLVPGDTNASADVFVRDLGSASTTRVSVTSTGAQANAASTDPSITGDGQLVTFTSWAVKLDPTDTNQASDVFLHDRATATTSLVSVNVNSGPANGDSANAEISLDGAWIAFDSFASDLVADDTNGKRDVFRRNRPPPRTPMRTERMSLGIWQAESNGDSFEPSVATTGDVLFSSDGDNLDFGDWNYATDVFLASMRQHGVNTRAVSHTASHPRGGWAPAISADASAAVFTSDSAILAPEDTNNASDLFMPIERDPHCTSSAGRQVDCDITAGGEPVPTTIKWYIDDTHEPSLDNMTSIHFVVLNCQPSTYAGSIVAVIAGGTGITALHHSYACIP
jgi:hypothetical protein